VPDAPDPRTFAEIIRRAFDEDLGAGDITSNAIIPADARATGVFLVKRPCVIAGLDVAAATLRARDPHMTFDAHVQDGRACREGEVAAHVAGNARALLAAERTALNFLQYLSGIATETRRFVDATGGRITILDTRKTTPGLRALAKYAVRCGGGTNLRQGLFDAVLIKDNHIRVAGGIDAAVRRVRESGAPGPIEVEAQSAADVDAAIAAGADIIMLDNFDDEALAEAVRRIGGRAKVEVSGGVTLARLPRIAASGADFVSIGALTHSAPAADISLELDVTA
jgi:nicotinate-nucleotide pyrophosphorylase (carboxylating)